MIHTVSKSKIRFKKKLKQVKPSQKEWFLKSTERLGISLLNVKKWKAWSLCLIKASFVYIVSLDGETRKRCF